MDLGDTQLCQWNGGDGMQISWSEERVGVRKRRR